MTNPWRSGAMAESMRYETLLSCSHKYTPLTSRPRPGNCVCCDEVCRTWFVKVFAPGHGPWPPDIFSVPMSEDSEQRCLAIWITVGADILCRGPTESGQCLLVFTTILYLPTYLADRRVEAANAKTVLIKWRTTWWDLLFSNVAHSVARFKRKCPNAPSVKSSS